MNIIKKAYCRVFQTAFRIALPILPYSEPKELPGVEQAAELFAQKKVSKVLIVTDAGIAKLGLLASLTDALRRRDIDYCVYSDTVPNPTIANVEAAREMYLSNNCQAIIGFGGGSSMDCAKIAAARVARPNMPVPKMRGILKIQRKLPLLVAVPTTAGTGSETTLAAVITDGDTHYKYPINDFGLIPRYAVLDPQLTVGLPRSITATTGLDALTHAVEAYIGRSTNGYTRRMAEEAVTLIHQYLLRACENGNDIEARRKMLRAAYCAGNAFTRSYVGYVHGVAHSLGGQYSVPHGLANAIILPHFLEEYGETIHPKLAKLARKCGIAPENAHDSLAARMFIDWVWEMNRKLDIPQYVSEIRIKDIPTMARHADVESNPLYPVPVLMDAKALEMMYYRIAGMEEPAYAPNRVQAQRPVTVKQS